MEEKKELTAREASDYSKEIDPHKRGISISYLVRAASNGRIEGARKIEGPVPYWVFDKTKLDEYLSSQRKPGRKITMYDNQKVLDTALEHLQAWGYKNPELYDRIIPAPPRAYVYKWYLQFKALKAGQPVYVRMIVQELSGGLAGTDYEDRLTPYSTPVF